MGAAAVFGVKPSHQTGPSSLTRISWASSWTVRILAFSSALEVGDLQRHFTGKQQGCDRALEFVAQGLLHFLPDQQDLLFCAGRKAARNSRATRSMPLMAKFTCTGTAVPMCSSTMSLSTGSVSRNA